MLLRLESQYLSIFRQSIILKLHATNTSCNDQQSQTHKADHWIYNFRKENFADVMRRNFMEKEPQRENLLEAEDSVEERDSLKEIGLIPHGNV